MENFFGLLKTKMFHDQEDNYKRLDDLIKNLMNLLIIIIMIKLK